MPVRTLSVSDTLPPFTGHPLAPRAALGMVRLDPDLPLPPFATELAAAAQQRIGPHDAPVPGVGSGVVVVTVAVFVTVVPLTIDPLKASVRLNVALVLGASVSIEQVTVGPVVQVKTGPFVCDSETKVVSAGRTSVSVTDAAF